MKELKFKGTLVATLGLFLSNILVILGCLKIMLRDWS